MSGFNEYYKFFKKMILLKNWDIIDRILEIFSNFTYLGTELVRKKEKNKLWGLQVSVDEVVISHPKGSKSAR